MRLWTYGKVIKCRVRVLVQADSFIARVGNSCDNCKVVDIPNLCWACNASETWTRRVVRRTRKLEAQSLLRVDSREETERNERHECRRKHRKTRERRKRRRRVPKFSWHLTSRLLADQHELGDRNPYPLLSASALESLNHKGFPGLEASDPWLCVCNTRRQMYGTRYFASFFEFRGIF